MGVHGYFSQRLSLGSVSGRWGGEGRGLPATKHGLVGVGVGVGGGGGG